MIVVACRVKSLSTCPGDKDIPPDPRMRALCSHTTVCLLVSMKMQVVECDNRVVC